MESVTILIVDDHPVVRQGIGSLLSNYPIMKIVGEAGRGADAVELVGKLSPDVVLLDISMPDQSGLETLRQIRHVHPKAKVLMLTSYDDEEYVMGALSAGAQGFILKNASDELLIHAIQAAHRGERVLSPQVTEQVVQRLLTSRPEKPHDNATLSDEERDILRLLTKGASNAHIADTLYLSSTTVKRRLRQIFEKMNVRTRAQAAAEAVRRDLV